MRTFSFKVEFSIRSYGQSEGYSGKSYLFYLRLSFLLVAVMLLVYYLMR